MNRKKEIRQSSRILLLLSLVLLIVVTAGVSYAVYDYTSLIPSTHIMDTATIQVNYSARNMNIYDSLPLSDEVGKSLENPNHVLDFTISATKENRDIPYEITIRKKSDSNQLDDGIKVYLTEIEDGIEKEVTLKATNNNVLKYSELEQTKIVNNQDEKVIYQGKVPANSTNYEKTFRLRMWVADDMNYFPAKDDLGNESYPFDNQNFAITVNVYSNAAVVSNE